MYQELALSESNSRLVDQPLLTLFCRKQRLPWNAVLCVYRWRHVDPVSLSELYRVASNLIKVNSSQIKKRMKISPCFIYPLTFRQLYLKFLVFMSLHS